jgi:hypothetical protein
MRSMFNFARQISGVCGASDLSGCCKQDFVPDPAQAHSRNRSYLRMRFICANRIAIVLRSRRDC